MDRHGRVFCRWAASQQRNEWQAERYAQECTGSAGDNCDVLCSLQNVPFRGKDMLCVKAEYLIK